MDLQYIFSAEVILQVGIFELESCKDLRSSNKLCKIFMLHILVMYTQIIILLAHQDHRMKQVQLLIAHLLGAKLAYDKSYSLSFLGLYYLAQCGRPLEYGVQVTRGFPPRGMWTIREVFHPAVVPPPLLRFAASFYFSFIVFDFFLVNKINVLQTACIGMDR